MKISECLPSKSAHLLKDTKRVSGLVPAPYYQVVSHVLSEEGYSWNEFITACLKSFLLERKIKLNED